MLIRLSAGIALAAACSLFSIAQESPTPPPTTIPATPIKPVGAPRKQPSAADITLKVGDPAPAIVFDEWLKGEPVKSFEPGIVYIVEFWASWCGPCLQAIPHLTELQKAHGKKLVIIGMASSERMPPEGAADKRLERLKRFVEFQDRKMSYRVAYDSKRAMPRTWMEPAGEDGIPTAFVVGGDGRIAWIGNPGDKLFDAQVEKALAAARDATGRTTTKPVDTAPATDSPAQTQPAAKP